MQTPMTLRYYEIAEAHHRIQNPLSEADLMLLGELCELKPGLRQLDLACGKGEMLCRWAQKYGIQGTGIDISPVFVEAARQRAAGLHVSSLVEFHLGDAAQFETQPETYDIVSCIGANWIGGGTRGTLELIRQMGLKRSPVGLVLMGEIFWKENPPDEAIRALGARGEWAAGLGEILEWFNQAGAQLVEMIIASTEDWDRYEAPKWLTFDRWKRQNLDDPELDVLVEYANKSQVNYLKYERPYCDWGVFVLRIED
jgi:SAM-dependent methyltransferase